MCPRSRNKAPLSEAVAISALASNGSRGNTRGAASTPLRILALFSGGPELNALHVRQADSNTTVLQVSPCQAL